MTDGRVKAVAVVAPAGYGKSTLMAQWFDSLRCELPQRCGTAWLNLDENDNDPERLLHYLIAALQAAVPHLQIEGTAEVQAPATSEGLLDAIGARLADNSRKVVLFIDDAHVLAERQALKVLEWLVRYAGTNLRFIIGCRQMPRVGMPELRLRGELVEIDQAALAFTGEEVEALWHQRRLGKLDQATAAVLLEKTEGWAAVIELLTLALNEEPDSAKLIADFSATERGVVDYLSEVVFGRLPASQREQIHRLAQFDRFCTALSVQACGPDVPDDLLSDLQRRKLFLVPLDRRGQWFRFHHLVGDYLRHHPPSGFSDVTRQTLLTGGQWFHANGMHDDAVDCAVRAQAWDLAARWLAASIEPDSLCKGASASVSRWLPLIPSEHIDRYPGIRLHYVAALAFLQKRDLLQRELAVFESLINGWEESGKKDLTLIDQLRGAVTMQRLMWSALRDEGPGMLPKIQAAMERWPTVEPRALAEVLTAAAYAAKTAGEIDLGLDYARRAREIQNHKGSPFGVSRSIVATALLWLKLGDYRAAQTASQDGLRYVAERIGGHPQQAACHQAVLAATLYEFDDTALAGQELESGLAAVDGTAIADVLILIYLTRARLQFLQGERSAGLQALRLGRSVGLRRDLPRLRVTLAAEECTWMCRFGDRTAALELAREFGFDRPASTSYDLLADKAARIAPRLMMDSSPELALNQLEPAIARSRGRGFDHRQVELLLLKATALLRAGREVDASAVWAEAVTLGERRGYRRVFLDDSDLIAPLLQSRSATDVPKPPWLKIRPKTLLPDVEEQLTRKELRILSLLESNHANREIAASLFISEGTLKWHLHNLYRKLGCKNRTGALAAAKQRGLLIAASNSVSYLLQKT